jgi:hypothetical protein
MEKANNLKNLDETQRQMIADNPVMWNFFVAAFGKRGDLMIEVRSAPDAADAEARAIKALTELNNFKGATLDDVYTASGDSVLAGGVEKCTPPDRWDPITQTCVPGTLIPE